MSRPRQGQVDGSPRVPLGVPGDPGMACGLCSILFADANGALIAQSMGPEAVDVEGANMKVSI